MNGNESRIGVLDCLRGIAALAVVVYHYTTRYFEIFHMQRDVHAFSYGYLGVNLFFIISGFVIFMTVSEKMTAHQFFVKRFSRLYPPFLFAVLVTFALVKTFGIAERQVSFNDMLFNFTMIPEFFNAKPVDGAYWSLLPEFFFYVFMGSLIFLKKTKKIIMMSLVWLMLSYISAFLPFPDKLKMMLNINWSPYFIAGIMFYLLFSKRVQSLTPHWIIALCFMRVVPVTSGDSYAVLLIFLCFFVFYLFINRQLEFLIVKPLVFLGAVSYPLYLLHQNIGYLLLNTFRNAGMNSYVSIITVIGLMITAAYIVHISIEKPLTRYLSKILLKRKTSADTSEPAMEIITPHTLSVKKEN